MEFNTTYGELGLILNEFGTLQQSSPYVCKFLLGQRMDSFYKKNAIHINAAQTKRLKMFEDNIEKDEHGNWAMEQPKIIATNMGVDKDLRQPQGPPKFKFKTPECEKVFN